MNSNNNSKLARLARFVGNKGFYIVLFLCVVVIGVSAYVLTYTVKRTGLELEEDLSMRITASLPSPSAVEIPTINPNEINPAPTEVPQPGVNDPANPASGSESSLELEFEDSQQAMQEVPPDEEVIAEAKPDIAPTAFVWPVAGDIQTPHSIDALVYDRTMMDWRTHSGLDITGELGAKVLAVASGTVEELYKDQMMGTTVVIYHGGGLRSIYSNLAELPAVSVGSEVAMSDVVGAIGDTALAEVGDVTHLHFEMTLNGESVDPNDYLPER